MSREVAEQPDALRRTLAHLTPRADDVLDLAEGTDRVLLVARGSSDHAALYAHYLLGLRAGRLATSASPSFATAYDVPLDLQGTLAVAVSQSGATQEIVETLGWASRNGARTLAITNVEGSDLAAQADLTLVTQAGPEQALPATKSHTTQLAAVALVGAALAAERDGGRDLDLLAQVPDAVAQVLANGTEGVEQVVGEVVGARTVVVAGRGYHSATAREIALKLQEACEVPAVGLSWADLLHGPLALLDAEAPALLVAPPTGPVLAGTVTVARRLAERGAPVFGIGGDGAFAAACRLVLPASDLPEHLAPIAAVVPGQQLAEALARRLGLDPDHPRGLRKVTQTDAP
jgi:glucosamine--fructose-6-phosphate aminotransferase (isomerizing)